MRGSNNTAPIVQNEADWMGFSSFQDIVLWADVREVTTTGNVTLSFETAPTKDEVLFQQLTGASIAYATGASNVTVKTVLLASNPAIPLSTWVRWKLANSLNATWDITFRVLASANRVVR
jgi:hypothetical protein